MKNGKVIISGAAFLILVLLVFTVLVMVTGRTQSETPDTRSGYVELTDFDFSKKLAQLDNSCFLYYREVLYTPEDFSFDRIGTEPTRLNKGRVDPGDYGTYRIIVRLPADGKTYGLSSYSAMYAQRLFIDGREYPPVGVTGETAEETVPMTKHYTVYFTPETEQVEIVIQFSNFQHFDYGGIMPMYLGSQQLITARDSYAHLRTGILFGCMMTVFLFFMGMFFFFRRRSAFLWFSLASFSVGLRMLLIEEKTIMLLFPQLPWGLAIELEYLVLAAMLLSVLMYINSVFSGALPRYVLLAYGAVCALFTVVVLTTQPIIFTGFTLPFQLCSAVFGIYVLAAIAINLVRKSDNRRQEHMLILSGILAFVVLSIIDIELYRTGSSILPGLAEVGMMILIFVNMIALVLGFARTEKELDVARRNEQEMEQTNLLLDRASRLRSEFMANISHEMRTPLTVMSSYAGLTSLEIRRGAVNEKTPQNLDIIKREAMRLSEMVEQLKRLPLTREWELSLKDISADTLLRQAVDFCDPICRRNKNRISASADTEHIFLLVNPDSVFQVFVNLIINANRHTARGNIRLALKAEPESGFAIASVCDDGEGIESEMLSEVFERGVSGDDSSGLGLSICREIVEEHGGRIWIESEKGEGTSVRFTLPLGKGDNHE